MDNNTPYHKDYYENGETTWKKAFIMSLWDCVFFGLRFLILWVFFTAIIGSTAEVIIERLPEFLPDICKYALL